MIIVKLKGGLGNQMFQYVFGRSLSLKFNIPVEFDLSSYINRTPGETKRNFELTPFGLDIIERKTERKFSRFHFSFLERLSGGRAPILINDNYNIDDLQFSRSANIILDGYFQNEKYFNDYDFLVRNEFLKNRSVYKDQKNIEKKISEENAVCIHVRRGDYVSNPVANKFHRVLPVSYYTEAIARMRQILPTPEFFFFSDDIEWCKDHFENEANVNFIFFEPERSPVYDLWLMSYCSNFIIGNSSFSWWAAWISESTSKKIIAPKKWIEQPNSLSFALPEKWIQI